MANWRNFVDKSLKDHLEFQIKESSKHSPAYKQSKNPSDAQLWIAVANLSREIFDLNLKVKFLEKVLQDMNKKSTQKKETKDIRHLKKSLKKL